MDKTFKHEMKKLLKERFQDSPEQRVLNSYDAMNRMMLPDCVAEPETEKEILSIIMLCNKFKIPIVPRGAGCGFSGGALPVNGGLTLNLSRMKDISIDRDNLVAEVGPGAITIDIHEAAEALNLFYPPDPASMKVSTIGGNIAENAGGPRAAKYGVTKAYVLALRVALMDGSIATFGRPLRKDVAGYNLTPLFVGSEGTLGIITRAWLKLLPRPETALSAMLAFDTALSASRAISSIVAAGLNPSRLEIMDSFCIQSLKEAGHHINGNPGAILMVEVDGPARILLEQLDQIREVAARHQLLSFHRAENESENKGIWELRRSLSPIINTFGDSKMNEDVVVPRSRVPDLFAYVEQLRSESGLTIVCFGHAGDGNIHVNVMYDVKTPGIGEKVESALHQLFEKVVAMGGSISGEHGIGIAKQRFMRHQFSESELNLMRRIKEMFDPLNLLNPGKILPKEEKPE
ncbi:MAG: glycolate oxidase subunit GlcD [Acidobacteria bacterium]|nr:MAG: glycolate oxidase subunit GlcD [Acidobacteriota bacterium]